MKILIVENDAQQMQIAKSAVEQAGHEAMVVSTIRDAVEGIGSCDVVVTDLYFPPTGDREYDGRKGYITTEPPSGLCIVILAMSQNKGVAVCTSGDHHDAQLGFVFDGFLSPLYYGAKEADPTIDWEEWMNTGGPFGWIESKNWTKAVEAVVARAAK